MYIGKGIMKGSIVYWPYHHQIPAYDYFTRSISTPRFCFENENTHIHNNNNYAIWCHL